MRPRRRRGGDEHGAACRYGDTTAYDHADQRAAADRHADDRRDPYASADCDANGNARARHARGVCECG